MVMPATLTNPYPVINESITVYPAVSRLLEDLHRQTGLRKRHLIGALLDIAANQFSPSALVAYIEGVKDYYQED